MKKPAAIVAVAFSALLLIPEVASADSRHRFGTDRGSRYSHGGYRSSSRSYFDVSIGFGSGGYHHGGFSYSSIRFGSSPKYYRGGHYRPYSYGHYYRPAPVVVYSPPPVVYAPPPVIYSAPPVYYSAPRVYTPVYTSSYYYSSGGYYCGR